MYAVAAPFLLALGLSLALMPMIARVAQAGGGHSLIPLLECVDNNGDGTSTAHFGYLNHQVLRFNCLFHLLLVGHSTHGRDP